MPSLRCRDDSWQALWVDVVAYSSSFVYGVFIPLQPGGFSEPTLRQNAVVQKSGYAKMIQNGKFNQIWVHSR
jgi:hypothetical protein